MDQYSNATDREVLAGLERAATSEREATAEVLAWLVEMDRRDLARKQGYSSLFDYCVRKLGYAEGAAYKRIHVARIKPARLELLADIGAGRLTLSAATVLAPHLKAGRVAGLLERAHGKSMREVERLVAELAPKPDAPDLIRTLHVPPAATEPAGPAAPCPPGASRVLFRFTADENLRGMISRARALLRHKFPYGRLEDVLSELAVDWLRRHDPASKADLPSRSVPAGGKSRRVPESVRRAVWKRDGGRCAFVAESGLRCGAEAWLEFDHATPWALGGPSNDAGNIRLLCRAHNQLEARRIFGDRP